MNVHVVHGAKLAALLRDLELELVVYLRTAARPGRGELRRALRAAPAEMR